MIARFHYDDATLHRLLKGEMEASENDVLPHVETCEQCQSQLETLSGDGMSWDDVRDLMRQDDVSAACQLETSPNVSFLQPTDHPESLGRFARYEIMEVLGRGGMGIVMRGFDPALDRHCAIKALAPELSSSGPARRRFSREAKSAAAVVHPHVVPIQNVDEHDGVPYLVMPVVEGPSLQSRVDRDGPLETIEVVRIAAQVAAGLAAAHGQGLVHRDIKPANILLENGIERVQITDFGLARAIDDASMTRSGVIAGTPQYMSPEQAHGDSIDHRSDLFSLGSVMYFMLTGRSPFRAETTMGVLNRIANDRPKPISGVNSDVPVWLEQIVMKLLAKTPDDRVQSASETSNLLEGCLAHLQNPTSASLPIQATELEKTSLLRSPSFGVFTVMTLTAVALLVAFQVSAPSEAEKDPNANAIQSTQEAEAKVTRSAEDKKRDEMARLLFNGPRAIGKALHKYHEEHDGLPPAVVDGKGGAKHSWRVAILPQLGLQKLYDQYKLDEPWDSEANKKVLQQIPDVFKAYGSPKDSTSTSYFAVVGKNTAFDVDGKGKHFRFFRDGLSNTLLVVEAKRDIPWTKPQDIDYSIDKPLPKFGGSHEGGFACVFADAYPRFISTSFRSAVIHNILGRADRGAVDLRELKELENEALLGLSRQVHVGQNRLVSGQRKDIPHFEVVVACDPTNVKRMLISSMAASSSNTRLKEIVTFYSSDGGSEWSTTHLESDARNGKSYGDPHIVYGSDGTAFQVSLQGVTGLKAIKEILAASAVNIWRSSDSGKTWQAHAKLKFADRPFLLADRNAPQTLRCFSKRGMAVSRDSGKSFTDWKRLIRTGAPYGMGNPIMLSDGTMVATYPFRIGGGYPNPIHVTLTMHRSIADGESGTTEIAKYRQSNDTGVPSLAADTSASRTNDRLYVVWSDITNDQQRVFVSRSIDKGETWSDPILLSEQSGDAKQHNSYLPTIAVNSKGVVGLTWHDTRELPDGETGWNIRFRCSYDGGDTWLPSVRVTEQDSIIKDQKKRWAGHTAGLATDIDGGFHAVWIDNRSGVRQVWTSKISVSSN